MGAGRVGGCGLGSGWRGSTGRWESGGVVVAAGQGGTGGWNGGGVEDWTGRGGWS